MHLVEKNERIVRYKLCLWVDETDLFQDVVGFETRVKNGFVLWLRHEVDFDEIVVIFGELFYRKSLSHLPRPFHDERQSLGILLPLQQKSVYFSFKYLSASSGEYVSVNVTSTADKTTAFWPNVTSISFKAIQLITVPSIPI